MSVLSKALDSIIEEAVSKICSGQVLEREAKFFGFTGKLIVTVDTVESRDVKSESGIDFLWISFDSFVVRFNASFEFGK